MFYYRRPPSLHQPVELIRQAFLFLEIKQGEFADGVIAFPVISVSKRTPQLIATQQEIFIRLS